MRDDFDRCLESMGVEGFPTDQELGVEYDRVVEELLVPDGAIVLGSNRTTGRVGHLMPPELAYGLVGTGRPGIGKSTSAEVIGPQLIDRVLAQPTETVIVLDPHGPLAEYLLQVCIAKGVPPERVLYVDLLAQNWVALSNPLYPDHFNSERPERGVAQASYALLEAMMRAIGVELVLEQPQTAEAMFSAGAVVSASRHSFAELPFMVQNTRDNLAVRDRLLATVADPTVVDYYSEINRLPRRELRAELASAARRFAYFLRYEPIKLSLGGSTGPGIDFRRILEVGGYVVILNLGIHDTDMTQQGQRFLGSLWLSQLLAAVRRRKKNASAPCYLCIDEFQRFVGFDLLEGMVELRGFGLHGFYFHHRNDQLWVGPQLDPRLARAVLSIPNKLIYSVGLLQDQLDLCREAVGPWVDLDRRKLELQRKVFKPILKQVAVESYHTAEGDADSENASWSETRLGGAIGPSSSASMHGAGWSRHSTRGRAVAEQWITDHEELTELAGVQFESAEDQVYRFTQQAIKQGVGEAIFMKGYKEPPLPISIPRRREINVSPRQMQEYVRQMIDCHPQEFISVKEATSNIAARHRKLVGKARRAAEDQEDNVE